MSDKNFCLGKQSAKLKDPVYILDGVSVVGKKEGEGPLKDYFDSILEDELNGCNCWEEAESSLQRDAVSWLLKKTDLRSENIDYIIGGDLLGQSIASTFGLLSFELPFIGLYAACATMGLSIGIGSFLIAGGFAENVISVTSSHFASAEKEFRFPLAYGNQRPLSATWTVTGSGALLLSQKESAAAKAKITGLTLGKIIDFGLRDAFNMGACMAPAAADVIERHLKDFSLSADYYDAIFTGDLGNVGRQACIDLLKKKDILVGDRLQDCGIKIFDSERQNTQSGGSGCGCSAVVMASYILNEIHAGTFKNVLFVPTGALLSKTSFNEGKSIPGIAHAIQISSLKSS